MGVDYSTSIYAPNFDMFARPIVVTPLVSQPGQAGYPGRGIYNHNRMNVALEDGSTFVEQETILDLLAAEFPVPPVQGDQVDIPADGLVPPIGSFTITSVWDNGGGELDLHLRKLSP